MPDQDDLNPPTGRAAADRAAQQRPSRRSVLRGAAGAGAAGLAATAFAGMAAPALASARPASAARSKQAGADDTDQVVVHVRDTRSGEIDVFRGTSHVRLHDRELAARLARAASR